MADRVEGYGTQPVGHVFSDPILFAKPILDVPGEFGYWKLNPRKPQFERQQKGLDKATALLKRLKYKPVVRPELIQSPASKPSSPQPDPNRLTVVFGSRSIGFITTGAIWDIDNPSEELVRNLRKKADFFNPDDDSTAWLHMTPEEVKAIAR